MVLILAHELGYPVQDLRHPLLAWVLPYHTPPQQCHAILVAYGAMTSTHNGSTKWYPVLGSCHIIPCPTAVGRHGVGITV